MSLSTEHNDTSERDTESTSHVADRDVSETEKNVQINGNILEGNKGDVEEEDIFIVPAHVATKTVGFSLDGGGSVTKLVYRSKKDYRNCQPINNKIPANQGFLRAAKFPSNRTEEIVPFLQRECDVNTETSHKKVYTTGIYNLNYEKEAADLFNVCFYSATEFDLLIKGMHHQFSNHSLNDLVYAHDEKAIAEGEELLDQFKVLSKLAETHSRGKMLPQFDKDDIGKEEEKTSDNVVPCLLAQMGSAGIFHKVVSDWTYEWVDLSYVGGRSFLGLSSVVNGKCQTFPDLMAQASIGHARNVDVHSEDTKVESSEDIYGEMKGDMPFFLFGKPTFRDPESFSRSDMTASLINLTCAHYAQYTHLVATVHGMDKVFISGGFCNDPLTRYCFTKFWHPRTMFGTGKKIDLYYLKTPMHLTALGAYLQEAEDNV